MSVQNRLFSSSLARKYPFFSLVQPLGDVIAGLREAPPTD